MRQTVCVNEDMNKLISIIIPSYNMEKYLPKCLDSLVVDDAELLQLLDVIVVNDGSKDRTSEIAHEFEAKYPGVFRVIDKSNGHYGSCINAGVKVAAGEYVKVLDADDWFDTEGFKRFLEFISKKQDDGIDAFINDMAVVDAEGNSVDCRVGYPTDWTLDMDYLCGQPMIPSMHVLTYRRQMLLDMHYTQTEGMPYTDGEWSVLPMLEIKRLAYCDKVVYHYLRGRPDQSITRANQVRDYRFLVDVLEAVLIKSEISLSNDPSLKKRCYMEKWLYEYLNLYVYSILVAAVPTDAFKPNFLRVESLIKDSYPEVWERLGHYTVSRRITFKWMDFMRRHHKMITPTIIAVRLVQCILSCPFVHKFLVWMHGEKHNAKKEEMQ